jgi:UrcA family protein
MTRIAPGLFASFIVLIPITIFAASPAPVEVATGSVNLTDIDLSTPTGVAEAHRRVLNMSKHLCRKFQDDRTVSNRETYVDCVHDTLAAALCRLNAPSLAIAKYRP